MKSNSVGWIGLWLIATANLGVAADTAQTSATVLMWQEQEPGIAPYVSRMLLTPEYLRSDAGRDDTDYLLFDRNTRQIYSVSHAQRSMLVITADPVPEQAGPRPAVDVQVQPYPDAPRVAGRVVSHFRLSSGGEECMLATVVPELLPEVTAALRELRGVLAGRQYRDLDKMPEATRTPCFLANYVYASDRHLHVGLPIQESISRGMQRMLIDYHLDQSVPAALFALPPDYERVQIP